MNTITLKPTHHNDKGIKKNVLGATSPNISEYPWSKTFLKNEDATNQNLSVHAAHVVAHSFIRKILADDSENVQEFPTHREITHDIEKERLKIFKNQQARY